MILLHRGTLKIAEVESRFKETPVDAFVATVQNYGFQLKWKDLKHKYFVLIDFKKVSDSKKKGPELFLKPCFYKKR